MSAGAAQISARFGRMGGYPACYPAWEPKYLLKRRARLWRPDPAAGGHRSLNYRRRFCKVFSTIRWLGGQSRAGFLGQQLKRRAALWHPKWVPEHWPSYNSRRKLCWDTEVSHSIAGRKRTPLWRFRSVERGQTAGRALTSHKRNNRSGVSGPTVHAVFELENHPLKRPKRIFFQQ